MHSAEQPLKDSVSADNSTEHDNEKSWFFTFVSALDFQWLVQCTTVSKTRVVGSGGEKTHVRSYRIMQMRSARVCVRVLVSGKSEEKLIFYTESLSIHSIVQRWMTIKKIVFCSFPAGEHNIYYGLFILRPPLLITITIQYYNIIVLSLVLIFTNFTDILYY